jgi:hypothetical protein
MRMARTIALTALIAAFPAWGATVPPESGQYVADITVSEAHGAKCPDHHGAYYQGVVYFGGLDAKRMTIRIPIVLDDEPVVEKQVLAITSDAGTLKPEGALSVQMTPSVDPKFTGSFEAELTLSDDRKEFTEKITEMAPSIDCTEVLKMALVHASKGY